MIQAQRTYLPSHVVRRAAFERLAAGTQHLTYSDWLGLMRARFKASHPQHRKASDAAREAFDRWLERLQPSEGATQQ